MEWADKLKEEYGKIAAQNIKANQFGSVVNPILDEPIRTDDSVAKDLDVGRTTYRKAEYIYENADDEMIKSLDEGRLLSLNKIDTLTRFMP
ncbi:MAG: hypothetical protein GX340_00280 [Clostridiales bacterium]|nr:hypothetical protein [Clostridiales bacterium]